jgi:hypothetical protein
MLSKKSKSLPWDIVEKAITKEQRWLEQIILKSPYENLKNVLYPKDALCENCIYRRIAILIISGKIKAKDIKSEKKCLWGNIKLPLGKSHGKEWHAEMMSLTAGYFKSLRFDVAKEPSLNIGRADLGIYKKGMRDLFVEIGTVSLPKLMFNLETMKNSDFLLVLESNHAVELSVLETGYKWI